MKKTMKRWRSVTMFFVAFAMLVTGIGMSFVKADVVNAAQGPDASVTTPADGSDERTDRERAKEAGDEITKEIVSEGAVLLKNGDVTGGKALPLSKTAKITVFGKNSVKPTFGLGGSSGGGSSGNSTVITDALEAAGFDVNPTMKAFYADNSLSTNGRPVLSGVGAGGRDNGLAVGETPTSRYRTTETSSFASYSDAAVIVLTRAGGEGWDLPRVSSGDQGGEMSADGGRAGRTTDHYLQLDKNEEDLLKMVKDAGVFGRIIVLINSGNAMELGFLNDATYGVDAAMIIGHTGGKGMDVLGKLLNGDVNPSGRTADIFPADFKQDPVWFNFADNVGNGNKLAGSSSNYSSVFYREGIYLGYRYYETRGYEEGRSGSAGWYDEHVVYPFGYGLSYTNFSWELVGSTEANGFTKDGTVTLDVKVTNTGSRAGKEVVQLYYSAPYKGTIEKSHVVLGAFGKTDLLAPNASQTLSISIPVKELASWSMVDGKYVLETGAYTIYAGRDSHVWADSSALKATYNLGTAISYDTSSTGYAYKNQFQEETDLMHGNLASVFSDTTWNSQNKTMSRENFAGTMPDFMTLGQRALVTANWADQLHNGDALGSGMAAYDAGKPWETDEMPEMGAENNVMLGDLYGLSAEDPLWSDFLDQLTFQQMRQTIGNGGFAMGLAIPELGIFNAGTPDGPFGFARNSGNSPHGTFNQITMGSTTCWYASPTLIAQSFNQDLAERVGIAMGNEGLVHGFAGIYAPGMNTHRSQFGGRNSEYYSEDPLLSGKIAAATIRGLQSKGVVPFMKHYFMNDQETNRDNNGNGLITYADEQTIREVYADGWRIAVEEGGALGVMSSFARVGRVWAGANYAVMTELLRNEWGFDGVAVTDWGEKGYFSHDKFVRAGNDMVLTSNSLKYTNDSTNATHVANARKANHHVYYALAQSNASVTYATPIESEVAFDKSVSLDMTPRISVMTVGMDDSLEWTTSGTLPQGLSYSSTTGLITGTPTTASDIDKDYEFTVTVTREGTRLATNTFTITVVKEATDGTCGCASASISSQIGGFLLVFGVALLLAALVSFLKGRKQQVFAQ